MLLFSTFNDPQLFGKKQGIWFSAFRHFAPPPHPHPLKSTYIVSITPPRGSADAFETL